jgi:hypothetical protein
MDDDAILSAFNVEGCLGFILTVFISGNNRHFRLTAQDLRRGNDNQQNERTNRASKYGEKGKEFDFDEFPGNGSPTHFNLPVRQR